jgi:hypothetical protein
MKKMMLVEVMNDENQLRNRLETLKLENQRVEKLRNEEKL